MKDMVYIKQEKEMKTVISQAGQRVVKKLSFNQKKTKSLQF